MEIKSTELHLWEKIRRKTLTGRRTGLGTTAEGDMIAALGLRYGTPAATDFSERVHRAIALSAYSSSVIMAGERGAFEIYDFEREINNPFMRRLFDASPELKRTDEIQGTPQHRMPDHSANRHHISDDTHIIRNRTGVYARISPSP